MMLSDNCFFFFMDRSPTEIYTLPLLAALPISRAEATRVLRAVINFGAPAEKWYIEGIKSKKSFMRQGCALGLGALKTDRKSTRLNSSHTLISYALFSF